MTIRTQNPAYPDFCKQLVWRRDVLGKSFFPAVLHSFGVQSDHAYIGENEKREGVAFDVGLLKRYSYIEELRHKGRLSELKLSS